MDISFILKKALRDNQLDLTEEACDRIIRYLHIMVTWNKVFNLTTITLPTEMIYLHIIDSLLVQSFLYGDNCLDVGSGAGLPGIPLAITHPLRHWTLVDKNNKKTRFLTQVVSELALKNVSVIHHRSELLHTNSQFTSILSRAFGTLRFFIETTQHLLAPGGQLIAMKGKYPKEELSDIPNHFLIKEVTEIKMIGMPIERHVVLLEKA